MREVEDELGLTIKKAGLYINQKVLLNRAVQTIGGGNWMNTELTGR